MTLDNLELLSVQFFWENRAGYRWFWRQQQLSAWIWTRIASYSVCNALNVLFNVSLRWFVVIINALCNYRPHCNTVIYIVMSSCYLYLIKSFFCSIHTILYLSGQIGLTIGIDRQVRDSLSGNILSSGVRLVYTATNLRHRTERLYRRGYWCLICTRLKKGT